jgi:putative component of membrane protein insertase Oxa1/YidC/SpoIIIJ protein YidD
MDNLTSPGFAHNTHVCPVEAAAGIPGEAEQAEAWDYVCRRILPRPALDIKTALKYSALFLALTQGLALVLCLLLQFTLFGYFLPSFLLYAAVSAACFFTGLGVCAKKLVIGLIKLYQHYAPERIRRKCIFKPTCSEYMILAIEKYGLAKGLCKGFYRLFVKCRGYYYSIDYP